MHGSEFALVRKDNKNNDLKNFHGVHEVGTGLAP
jgi:hypothetical protein